MSLNPLNVVFQHAIKNPDARRNADGNIFPFAYIYFLKYFTLYMTVSLNYILVTNTNTFIFYFNGYVHSCTVSGKYSL